MSQAEVVLKRVLKKITPTERQKLEMNNAIKKIMKTTERVTSPMKLKHTLAGSFLRDTWLADKQEFDIFILFPENVPREKLEKTGLDIGKKIVTELNGRYEIAYAEHPYVRAVIGKYSVDIVPCYDVKNPGRIKSAVDRTPHHNRYILKKLTPSISPQVRLLKQFCKGMGVYGSDLRVEGFAGYLTELLIIHYRTFKNLMMHAGNWDAGDVLIDLEGRYAEKKISLKSKFPGQPLVVIDPVDRNRNVAASLSPANFELFKQSCRSFLESPSESYFMPKKVGISTKSLWKIAKNRGTKLIAVSFSRPDVVDDVLFPQLRRSAKRMVGILEDGEFRILGYDVWCNKEECVIFFELEVWCLPAMKKITGPPVFSRVHTREFIKKYEGRSRLWVEGADWVADMNRKYTMAEDILESNLRLTSRQLVMNGMASYVTNGLVKGFVMLKDRKIIKKAAKNKEFSLFLTQYFKKKII